MKRLICLITTLCLVFGSFSFVFADEWGSSQISSVVNNVSSINTTLSNIYTRVNTITNYLTDSNHSVAYWTSAIASWMQPIYTALTSNLHVNLGLDTIISGLNEVVSSGGVTTYYPYLKYDGKSNANWLSDIAKNTSQLDDQNFPFNSNNVGLWSIGPNGQATLSRHNYSTASWYKLLILYIAYMFDSQSNIYKYSYQYLANNYNTLQSLVSFADPDSTVSFTPTSAFDGVYKYLNAINTPVARLGYVLASDSRIEAQEAASANEQAVVDNFIDSNGAGSASTNDISSVSDLSSGYKQNFGTDASVSGIFNIFNSNNMGWFSAETFNQLDTTQNTRKGTSINTPLLDKQINDIYKAIGLDNND